MECLVYRVSMRDPGDVSGISALIDGGTIAADEILAIFGKTEGNGCVNDFTRGYAMSALSAVLAPRLGVAADAVPERVAMVMSGGTEGGLSPHFLVFAVRPGDAPRPGRKALAIGTARTEQLRPEVIGRAPQAMAVAAAEADGRPAAIADTYASMGLSRGAAALGEIDRATLDSAAIGRDVLLWS